jgi:NAD(P)-dependent dehydrogenase (short-subunit alcohol dehydrogenase family)
MGEELSGKVAVVTGGTGGLGWAMVDRFAAEGARVVVGDVDLERGEQLSAEFGDAVAFLPTDVSDAGQVQALVDLAVSRFGGLHVMCNNAGISGAFHRLLDDDLTDFAHVLGVNLFGAVLGTQRSARHMAEHGGGSIINTTSIAGLNPGSGLAAYRSSKAALIHFTKSAAIDLAEYGVRVNCIAPAHIPTPINTSYDMATIVRLMQPLARIGSPSDVADAALFLAGSRSAQITGIVLPVDGGTTAGPPANQLRTLLAGGTARSSGEARPDDR